MIFFILYYDSRYQIFKISIGSPCWIAYLICLNHLSRFLTFLGMWPTFSFHCVFLHNGECKYTAKVNDIINIVTESGRPRNCGLLRQQMTIKINVLVVQGSTLPRHLRRWSFAPFVTVLGLPLITYQCSSIWRFIIFITFYLLKYIFVVELKAINFQD